MHRAKALEHRGIITTYKLHDRVLGNRRARRLFEHTPPTLNEVQARVLADLDAQDYATASFADLLSAESLTGVMEDASDFIATGERSDRRDAKKDYLIRRYARGQEIAFDSPWFTACLSSAMLDLANAYLRMWSKLVYVDFWYSVPVDADSDRIQSQRWHRDFDDRHLLKAFLYLVDVDDETGPFEFVAGSARGGQAAGLYPWYPLSPAYPREEEFERVVAPEDIRTFTAPKGTLVLCNTSGFHRGGFATAKPRVLATTTYCSPASLRSLTERNFWVGRQCEALLSGPQRFAVT